ncbi:hypothetical protein ABFS82_04G159500 [Erythranthe guttata]|uniref:Pectinesterase inhibitor domain-containing protein n=1 Tax=Erythranthe guttata TaxID=4155 RepID=A0A022Q9W1_ERYGU|nr:hypothetical protein MIMGU_mgv1a011973mg [Erythranthe guttata]
MDSSDKASLLLRDDRLHSVRRRNKTLIIIFFSLIMVLALIIGGIVISLVQKINSQFPPSSYSPAIRSFCAPSNFPPYCMSSLFSSSAIRTQSKTMTKPSQVFLLSLRTSVEHLSGIISAASSGARPEPAFANCLSASAHAVGQLNKTMYLMRVDPDLEMRPYYQRRDMSEWIGTTAEDLARCAREMWKVESKVFDGVYKVADLVRFSKEFLDHYGNVNTTVRWDSAAASDRSSRNWIVEDLVTVSLFGSGYLLLVFLFCLLLRIY